MSVSWRIYTIHKLWPSKREDILATGEFTLYHKKERRKVSGWLPSHHGNIEYHLKLGTPNRNGFAKILAIEHITTSKKMGRPVIKAIANKMSQKSAEKYIQLANEARESMALWTIAVVYPYYKLPNDIQKTFERLTANFSHICQRGDPDAIQRLIYDPEEALATIFKGLKQMGEIPNSEDWTHLNKMMKWQQKTRWDTAAKEKPAWQQVEKYKDLWADMNDIHIAKTLQTHFTKENTTIVQGSPAQSTIPKNAVIVVRSAEDAYKWKTRVDWGQIKLMRKFFSDETYKELGIPDIQTLDINTPHIHVAYAHLWSQEEWTQLMTYNCQKYTIIGRLDQYSRGRGQVFRDMCESNRFNTEMTRHVGAEAIFSETTLEDIDSIVQKHGIVQCFGQRNLDINTGRVQLAKPYRIRTLRPSSDDQRTLLYEEQYTEQTPKPIGVINVRTFHGVRPIAGIYICSEETTPFDIHMARTVCRDALYIIGEQPCMFAFERRPPKRITINPFI